MPYPRFSELLSEGISSVARRQRWKLLAIDAALTKQLGQAGFRVAKNTVKDWRLRGILPREPKQVEILVRYCVAHGRVDRSWAESLLQQARYVDYAPLLDELFPDANTGQGLRDVRRAPLPPSPSGDLVGREAELDRVMQGLLEPWTVISIFGFAGNGKTHLALEVAHRCLPGATAERPPLFTGVVWISTTDRPDQKLWLTEVLDRIARGWGYTPHMSHDQKRDEVSLILQENPTLVVIDSYETIEDPELDEWILHPPARSKVLVTSQREQPQNAWHVQLKGLAGPEATKLIQRHARRLDLAQIEHADAGELQPLIDVTNGNPKAIVMALSYLKRSKRTLRAVANDLRRAHSGVQDVFDQLYTRHWEALTIAARHLLLALSLFAEAVDRDALGAVAGLSDNALDKALNELLDRFLLETSERQDPPEVMSPWADEQREPAPRDMEAAPEDDALLPYSLHPLTRAFASAKLAEDAAWEQEARARWVSWYLDFTKRYARRDPHSHRDESGWSFPHEPVRRQWRNLLAVSAWCDAPGRERYADVRDLWHPDRMRTFAGVLGYWGDRVHWLEWLIAAAEQHGDYAVAVDAMSHLGWTLTTMGQLPTARTYLMRAWELREHVEPLVRLTLVRHLAWLCIHEERDSDKHAHEQREDADRTREAPYAEAERWLAEHTRLLSEVSLSEVERIREGIQVLEYRGMIFDATADYAQATAVFQRTLELAEKLQWLRPSLDARIRWADVARKNGEYATARALLDATLPAAKRFDDRRVSALCKRAYALLEQASGNLGDACRWAREALGELQRLGLQSETDELREVVAACCGAAADSAV